MLNLGQERVVEKKASIPFSVFPRYFLFRSSFFPTNSLLISPSSSPFPPSGQPWLGLPTFGGGSEHTATVLLPLPLSSFRCLVLPPRRREERDRSAAWALCTSTTTSLIPMPVGRVERDPFVLVCTIERSTEKYSVGVTLSHIRILSYLLRCSGNNSLASIFSSKYGKLSAERQDAEEHRSELY